MKNKKIIIIAAVAVVLAGIIAVTAVLVFGGKNQGSEITGTFSYDAEMLSEKLEENGTTVNQYNNDLFYVNTLDFEIADPTIIQITEGEEAGYFYVYGTSDEIGCHGIQAWRSKDLSNWECMGIALQPNYEFSWACNNYWAPEIIYDSNEKLYYLFYNAFNRFDNNRPYLSVAYSEYPQGPFIAPHGRMDSNGNMLDEGKPVYDFTVNNPEIAKLVSKEDGFVKAETIDASPFIDPVSGDKYMYFSYYDSYSIGSFTYGVKMKNWLTPDYSTLTMLTIPGYRSIEAYKTLNQNMKVREGNVNEGPFMVYRNGTYYLTLSVFGYTDPNYRVVQAISDHPLGKKDDSNAIHGDFVKVDGDGNGGFVLSSDVANWSHIVSAGHHCFFMCGDEMFIGYHTFKNRNDISGGRALAVDKIVWTKNHDGVEVMHTNGPTYSVQALPESVSGYKNIAPSATVTASNTADDSNKALLTDGLVKYQEPDLVKEYHAKPGTSVINLSWDTFKTVRAIMIFNSYDYEKTFVDVKSVELTVKNASGNTEVVKINNLEFDWDFHAELDWEFMRPGGSAIAEFYDMPVNNIKITIDAPQDAEALALGEIMVLGKDSDCAGISEFKPYSYSTDTFASPHIIRNSQNFGAIENTELETQWGFDVSHDDGSENAYITQFGVGEQRAYFKDVYSTDFFVEASFTVTNRTPLAGLNEHMYGDPYPKFGIGVSCDDIYENTLFYYVDAVDYVKSEVGVAQRNMANTDWDWTATEKLVPVAGLDYTDGNYVHMAIIRKGEKFYFICNDRVVLTYNQFNIFGSGQKAGVGFISFNTAMKIKDYKATSDASVINQKMTEYGIN